MLSALNPFLRYAAMHTTYTPPATYNVCYDCRLFFVLFGEGSIVADGVSYPVGEETAVFLPPETRYRFNFQSPKDVRIYVIDLDLTDRSHMLESSLTTATEESFCKEKVPKYDVIEPFTAPIVIRGASGVREHIASAVDSFFSGEAYFRETASAACKLALISMLRVPTAAGAEARLAERIISHIRQHYGSPTLSNKSIAEDMHYHPYYLSRIMKAHTGRTLHDYLTDYRIERARSFLLTTSDSVTKIAEACGFASYTYFIKTFRERVGHSPLKYRQLYRMIGL
ncbi:MAG: helix-turn-helix domain-containing protein [Clostridia bacterium]|nr:helix-turn-helix domain-containing protein [Clostridia bacterium]